MQESERLKNDAGAGTDAARSIHLCVSRLASATRWLALAWLLAVWAASPIWAQPGNWSAPLEFLRVDKDGTLNSPSLLLDSGGNLHALWSASTSGEPRLIYYSGWDGQSWSSPVDVVVSPDENSVWPYVAVVDRVDKIHLFWHSRSGSIWHTWANAARAGLAQEWASPRLMGTQDITFGGLSAAVDARNVVHVVYANRQLNAIRYQRSEDGGDTWSPEQSVDLEPTADRWVGYPSIDALEPETLFVTWNQMEVRSGRATAVLSSRSTDGGRTWSKGTEIARGYYFGTIRGLDARLVKLVVGGAGTGGRTVSFSDDDGQTWSSPADIGAGGAEGAQGVGTIQDSAGRWYFVEQTAGTFAIATWDGKVVSKPELVIAAEEREVCCPGDAQNASAAISDGNLLHLFWENDNNPSIIWYSTRRLDAPVVTSRPLGEPVTFTSGSGLAAPAAVPTPAPTWTPGRPVSGRPSAPPPSSSINSGLSTALGIGLLPVVLLISATALVTLMRRNR